MKEDIFIYNGIYSIRVYEKDIVIKEYEITIKSDKINDNGFVLEFLEPEFDPRKIYVDTEFGFVLKVTDSYGKFVPLSLGDDIKLKLIDKNEIIFQYITRFDYSNKAELKIYITSQTIGFAQLKLLSSLGHLRNIRI